MDKKIYFVFESGTGFDFDPWVKVFSTDELAQDWIARKNKLFPDHVYYIVEEPFDDPTL
jgi:hypothetical protein